MLMLHILSVLYILHLQYHRVQASLVMFNKQLPVNLENNNGVISLITSNEVHARSPENSNLRVKISYIY